MRQIDHDLLKSWTFIFVSILIWERLITSRHEGGGRGGSEEKIGEGLSWRRGTGGALLTTHWICSMQVGGACTHMQSVSKISSQNGGTKPPWVICPHYCIFVIVVVRAKTITPDRIVSVPVGFLVLLMCSHDGLMKRILLLWPIQDASDFFCKYGIDSHSNVCVCSRSAATPPVGHSTPLSQWKLLPRQTSHFRGRRYEMMRFVWKTLYLSPFPPTDVRTRTHTLNFYLSGCSSLHFQMCDNNDFLLLVTHLFCVNSSPWHLFAFPRTIFISEDFQYFATKLLGLSSRPRMFFLGMYLCFCYSLVCLFTTSLKLFCFAFILGGECHHTWLEHM